ncbi:MAG: hypothetical protein M3442_15480 [Chloroflexota bacterium]|nr:hypothetical protein [Chloroflexota bacterium]
MSGMGVIGRVASPEVTLMVVRRCFEQAAADAFLGVHYDDREFDRLVLAYREAQRFLAADRPLGATGATGATGPLGGRRPA